jgi:FdhD protein
VEPPPAPSEDAARAIASVRVLRVRTDGRPDEAAPDAVAVEAPLEVRFGGRPFTVLLRTPGHDEDLVRGFLRTEGVVVRREDVVSIGPPAGLPPEQAGHVLEVAVFPAPDAPDLDRPFYRSASCGACGKRSIASLSVGEAPVESGLRVSRRVLVGLPARLRAAQEAFERTGGVHACGLFAADGSLVVLREDVGRHNAVDKVVGWGLAEGRLPFSDRVMVVSGRVSFELVQKAAVAGVPVLAAVGAPSSLAVEWAERYGVTLAGFVRAASLNLYAHPERVID